MDYLKAGWNHFKTITRHRMLVCEGCFKVGLYYQGLVHDLSKYNPVEFMTGVKYFQGDRSPNAAERDAIGYPMAWLHHKGRNYHHNEFWTDFGKEFPNGVRGVKMPIKYLVENYMDRVAACKVYQKEKYTDRSAWEYFDRSRNYIIMHPETKKMLEKMLLVLAEKGEDEANRYIRHLLKKGTY